ncbi:hypothetical protein [Actinomyces gaoshouyii]|uniref:hypothetical protein n=1 Tax=Actinomyces gaoshouyii TaxID=1960083 RepID=UPI001301B334|nr:hypothetical protein [Actinomyces gaoshouyii]
MALQVLVKRYKTDRRSDPILPIDGVKSLIEYIDVLGIEPHNLLDRIPRDIHATKISMNAHSKQRDPLLAFFRDIFNDPQKRDSMAMLNSDPVTTIANHRDLGSGQYNSIIDSLMHVHCNRLNSANREFETDILWMLRKIIHRYTYLERG